MEGRAVDTANLCFDTVITVFAGNHLLGITKDRNVGVVSRKDELRLGLELANQLDHIRIDRLVVQIVLGLINDHDVVLALAQHE